MGEINNGQSHTVGPKTYWITSLLFHVNLPSHSWDTAIWKSKVNIIAQGHYSGFNTLSTDIAFVPYQPTLPILRYSFFKILPWKSKVKVTGEVKV